MFTKLLGYLALPLVLFLGNSSGNSASPSSGQGPDERTTTRERLIVATGKVTVQLNSDRLRGGSSDKVNESKLEPIDFQVSPNSFFTIQLFNDTLRGPEHGTMGLIWNKRATLPEPLNASANQLVIEKVSSSQSYDLLLRDGQTGFVFFNVEGNSSDYDAAS